MDTCSAGNMGRDIPQTRQGTGGVGQRSLFGGRFVFRHGNRNPARHDGPVTPGSTPPFLHHRERTLENLPRIFHWESGQKIPSPPWEFFYACSGSPCSWGLKSLTEDWG